MPGAVATAIRTGFAGKLPARGDFCTRGLPRSFCDPWDAWLAEAMTGSRTILGEGWLPAWLEAPIWRFALPGGHCGPDAAIGVMLPSVDRAGRHWPLMLGAVLPGMIAAPVPDEAWLDALEEAGLEAVLADATPERVEELLASLPRMRGRDGVGAADPEPDSAAPTQPSPASRGGLSIWHTAGAPRVAARAFTLGALPGPTAFARMLDDAHPGAMLDEAVA